MFASGRVKAVVLATLVLFFATLAGCDRHPTFADASDSTTAHQLAQIESIHPVKICLVQDKTGSANSTRTPQIQFNELGPIIEILKQKGGEISFGLIRDQSNRSLLRLRIDAPPSEPVKPSEKGNAFVVAKEKGKYAKEFARYQNKLEQWQAESEKQVTIFGKAVNFLAEQKPNAPLSDIWGAVLRCDLFLSESDASWRQSSRRTAVFITDGLHNTNSRFIPMKSGAKVIMVNGSASLGSLEKLKPVRFESPEAAFRFIVAEEGRK